MVEAAPAKDILLAEDDNDDVVIFELAMNQMNFPYLLRNATDGDMLFVMLKNKVPYILFLDIHMPCKDGIACIVEIRKNKEYDNLPVIMYTSNLAAKMIEDSFRSGANFYITKTNTINALVEKLKKIFAVDWNSYMHYPPQGQFVLS
ncbi:MAG: response regulator [Bacteroidetes bacterium]|nr:response regulator [Bacteroidota bacterium]